MSCKNTIKDEMNALGRGGVPFLFLIDFELEKPLIFRLDEIDPGMLLYYLDGITNAAGIHDNIIKPEIVCYPEGFETYLEKFRRVKSEIGLGNSYLLNLTCTTQVELNAGLLDVFHKSNAKFKIWFDDSFVCFSPETFITVKDREIRSYPMKGTIDASIPDAGNVILNDPKETAEHYTIVDLIRNDLSMVSESVRVERFRYLDMITTPARSLLQVSSEIRGLLPPDYPSKIGDLIFTILPAGSVSGAPKRRTCDIIAAIESSKRGYYTGVLGIFTGRELISGVMIRFIEKISGQFYYRSGGGITSFSDPVSEYKEMIDKIYVPVI